MAAKLLHSLTDDNPDLQKQIGCMTGIFQMFDRQPIFTGGGGVGGGSRAVAHVHKRPPHNGNSQLHSSERESNNTHLRSASREKYSHKNIQEKQRISTESSRPSFSSSSRSSSFSSLDCNREAHLEPASYDRIIFPETPSQDPTMSTQSSSPHFSRQSLDIRDFVKESMYREAHALSSIKPKTTDESFDPIVNKYRDSQRPPQSKTSADLNESLKALAKLQEAPWYLNEPRELLRSASYHVKEGSFSGSRDIAPRFSCDGRDSRDISKSTLVKLKDIPRLSLDSRESSMGGTKSMQKDSIVEFGGHVRISQQTPGNQMRPPSVVAKLMGLETLPNSIPLSSDANSVLGQSYPFEYSVMSEKTDEKSIRTSGSSRKLLSKEPRSPRWRNSEPAMKPILRLPIEPAPWKHIDNTKGSQKPAVRSMRPPTKASKSFPSVYSEIENRLKDLEFTQSGKDLRALKQILETMQSKGFLETKKEVRLSNEQQHSNPDNLELRSVYHNQKPWTGSSRHYESPIVIMKPANRLVEKSSLPAASVGNSIDMKHDRTTKTAQTSSRLAKDGNSGPNNKLESISPRMQQKKLELEKRSRPPTPPDPSKSRRQPNKQQSENNSPGGRRRPKQTGEVCSESRHLNHREIESSVQSNESAIRRGSKSALAGGSERSTDLSSCQSLSLKASKFMLPDLLDKKSTKGMGEEELSELGCVPPEYSSPVSVLDKVVCKDDSPSPVKYVGRTLGAEVSLDKERDSSVIQGRPVHSFVPDSTESGSTSEISRKKLQKIENLVQKLRRLNSTHDEASTDYIASLCENTNPDHRYVSEILLASGLLLRELGSSLTNFQFHPSGYPINPELFLVLEQTKASNLHEEAERTTQVMLEGKLHRKLIFDTVNEILARKLAPAVPGKHPGKRTVNAHKLLRDLCSEIELLQAKDPKCGSDDQGEDDGWKDILREDVMHQSDSWKTFDDEVSGAILDIERSIFKDLVNEIVIGESSTGLKTRPGRRRLFASS